MPAPETTIATAPPNPQLTTTAVFTFGATGSMGAEPEFECALDAEPFESCESPYLLEELTPGEHSLMVRAVDQFLNVDPTPARYQWRVIAPPLEPTITVVPPEPSIGNAHTFEFISDEPNATFECRITPNPLHVNTFEPCDTPHTYRNLPDGEYLFQVRAVNEFGIAGELPAEHSFEVGNPPDTTILAGPSGTVESTTAAIAFSSSEPGSTFECSLDGEPFVECLSPAVFPDTEIPWPELSLGTAHVRGAGDRHQRQHRPDARRPHLDRRRADARRDDDHGRARGHDLEHDAPSSASPPRSPARRSSARSTARRSPTARRRPSTPA